MRKIILILVIEVQELAWFSDFLIRKGYIVKGFSRKLLDLSIINFFKWKFKLGFCDGISNTLKWFHENYFKAIEFKYY